MLTLTPQPHYGDRLALWLQVIWGSTFLREAAENGKRGGGELLVRNAQKPVGWGRNEARLLPPEARGPARCRSEHACRSGQSTSKQQQPKDQPGVQATGRSNPAVWRQTARSFFFKTIKSKFPASSSGSVPTISSFFKDAPQTLLTVRCK